MPSTFVRNWINDVENCVQFWSVNLPLSPELFSVTPLPIAPAINPQVLSHNITSCCTDSPPSDFTISFDHFPEPYYGDSDDYVAKSAVVLFYNPGPHGHDQLHFSLNPGSFLHTNYLTVFAGNYYNLSASYGFCAGTVGGFITPKTNQLNAMLGFIPAFTESKPLFMDLVPWHSNKFKGLNPTRLTIDVNKEIWEKVLIPAVLNARNTSVTKYLNRGGKKIIVLLAVGAKYSRDGWLTLLGFNDITHLIPNFHPNTIIIPRGTGCDIVTPNGTIKIWQISTKEVANKFDEFSSVMIPNELIDYEQIIIINQWTKHRDMNILGWKSQMSLQHILSSF